VKHSRKVSGVVNNTSWYDLGGGTAVKRSIEKKLKKGIRPCHKDAKRRQEVVWVVPKSVPGSEKLRGGVCLIP